jgi:hypothetical protein
MSAVSMPGWIDNANCDQMDAALTRAVQPEATVIIADLTRTDFCGHAATTLVSDQAWAARAGARLRVAAAAPDARLIGQIGGAGHPLDFYPDLTTALAGPRSRGTAPARIPTATDYPRRLIPDAAARRSAGKLARRLSVVPPASQALPSRPPTAPA